MSIQSDRFPEGVIRAGCEHLGVALKRIPLIDDYTWSGSDFRFWHARFSIRCEGPLAWAIIRRLAYALNSSVPELWCRQPFVFRPEGEETMWHAKKKNILYWTIESTEPMLDPKEVADHLEIVLLSKVNTEEDWLNY